MMKRILKYGTGMQVPDKSMYLCTQVEDQILVDKHSETDDEIRTKRNMLVWHYFLVECESDGKPPTCRYNDQKKDG